MNNKSANWMESDNSKAVEQAGAGVMPNPEAPQLTRKKTREPARKTRGLYIQQRHFSAYATLVSSEKINGGKTSPELIEQAIELLLKEHKMPWKKNGN